jgi:hypothetical protein
VWNVPTFVLWLKRLPSDDDLTRQGQRRLEELAASYRSR